MKLEIIEKAWVVNPSNMEDPWHCCQDIYYGTKGQAKKCAATDNDGAKTLTGKDITFLNIQVVRSKKHDKVKYNGMTIKRWEIEGYERLERIKTLDPNSSYYVQDARSYVGNAVLWWAQDGKGYTTNLKNAHKYSFAEIKSFKPRDTDIIWEAKHVEGAIREYVDIQGLKREHRT